MALKYVLVTPARNEAALIEQTIQSVISQTILPKRWVIVSDGSTDDTDRIVEKYLAGRNWLELVRRPVQKERNFAAKVEAFNEGYARLSGLDFDVIGCMDADVTFEADFFEFLSARFERNPRLGVAGTHYVEGDFHSYNDSFMNVEHVNGACQLFRRACFEDIGGYVPIPGGGIDWVAVTTARMKGWQTRSYSERVFRHHRKIGTAGTSELGSRFRYGKKDYFLGGDPLWQLLRCGYQMTKPPYLLGGLSLMAGYTWCWLSGQQRPISKELVSFHRGEQRRRMREMLASPGAVLRRPT